MIFGEMTKQLFESAKSTIHPDTPMVIRTKSPNGNYVYRRVEGIIRDDGRIIIKGSDITRVVEGEK